MPIILNSLVALHVNISISFLPCFSHSSSCEAWGPSITPRHGGAVDVLLNVPRKTHPGDDVDLVWTLP